MFSPIFCTAATRSGFEIGAGIGWRSFVRSRRRRHWKLFVLRHEVGFAIHLDEHADLRAGQDRLCDDAFLGVAVRLFRGAGGAFLAEHIDRGFEVAIGFGEGALALHQTGVGFLAERFDELGHR